MEVVMDELDIAAVRELLDRQQIWNCMTSYARGMDRMDVECTKEAFHPDSWDDHGQVVMPGYENAEFGAEYHRLRHRYSQHYLSNHRCEINGRSEEHTSELQSLMRISYAVFCLKKKLQQQDN